MSKPVKVLVTTKSEPDKHLQDMKKRLIAQENEIRRLLLSETEMKEKIEQLLIAIAEKDNFFTIIAHDLRNSLQTLKGFIQILSEELDTLTLDQLREVTLHIKSSTISFSDLLENLMLWARLQRGLTHLTREVVQLLPVIMECVASISDSARNKEIEITCNIPEQLVVFADVNILQTVIRNLISNAVKFTHRGGKVRLSAKPSDNKNVEISISDSGVGMSHSMALNLFNSDSGISNTGSGGEHGNGLGLIICKDFIESQKGRIWVESEVDKGSIFYFTLPMKN